MGKNKNPNFNYCGIPNEEEEAYYLNALTFVDIYKRLKLLATNRYKWENLPDSCNAMYLEETLFEYGLSAFINDKTLGFLNTKCVGEDTINIYNIPIRYKCYGNMYDETFDTDDIVLVRNNSLMLPDRSTIEIYARKLTNAERTIDVNINAQKTPTVILCEESKRLSMINAAKKYTGNVPFIFGTKEFNLDDFKTLDLKAEYIADKIQEYKRSVYGEILTYLGINNVDFEKKERLTDDEVNVNNGLIQNYAEIGLAYRQQAAEQFNKKWNKNISVKKRSLNELKMFDSLGVMNNEQIHN